MKSIDWLESNLSNPYVWSMDQNIEYIDGNKQFQIQINFDPFKCMLWISRVSGWWWYVTDNDVQYITSYRCASHRIASCNTNYMPLNILNTFICYNPIPAAMLPPTLPSYIGHYYCLLVFMFVVDNLLALKLIRFLFLLVMRLCLLYLSCICVVFMYYTHSHCYFSGCCMIWYMINNYIRTNKLTTVATA